VAGFYHDHLFVPVGTERRAIEVLEKVRVDAVVADENKDNRGQRGEDGSW
jgi:hypothetical protein